MLIWGRRAAGATLPVCAALICAIVGQAQGQQNQPLAPAFVWSPGSYISAIPAGVTSRVSYEVQAQPATSVTYVTCSTILRYRLLIALLKHVILGDIGTRSSHDRLPI